MAASIIESIVLRLCGTIQLNNIHLRTDELSTFLLPYKPFHCFVGSLFADIPIVLNGKLDKKISDILLVFKGTYAHDSETDYNLIQRALQSWIGSIYFSLATQLESMEKKSLIASSQMETLQKSLDKLVITIEHIHIRIEDDKFLSYIPTVPSYISRFQPSSEDSVSSTNTSDSNQVMFISCKIGKIEFWNPTQKKLNKMSSGNQLALLGFVRLERFPMSFYTADATPLFATLKEQNSRLNWCADYTIKNEIS